MPHYAPVLGNKKQLKKNDFYDKLISEHNGLVAE